MDWLKNLEEAMDYIEGNLDGEIDVSEAASRACCSAYYFSRMFGFMVGIPLSEYIRRRRLTSAAFELQHSDVKVIDLANKYGYTSPTAFNRAFQAMHGVSPSVAREKGVQLKSYPRITFQVSIKGVHEMKYRIESHKAFTVAGIKEKITNDVEKNAVIIPQIWNKLSPEKVQGIASLIDSAPFGLLGVCRSHSDGEMGYHIAAATSRKDIPDWMQTLNIPEATWAIFEAKGSMPQAIQDVWRRIYSEWFPSSGYAYDESVGAEIEVYPDGDMSSDDYICEVWIPVIKG